MESYFNFPVIFWFGIFGLNGNIKYHLNFRGRRENNVSADVFERVTKDAEFLNYPIVCLN